MNELQITEYKNIRVLTTQQIAEAYGSDTRVISNNFNRNKDRYVVGKHYICLEDGEKRDFIDRHQIDDGSKKASKLYLWTEKGAFLHAKSLNTDTAWNVYDRLVDSYFNNQKTIDLSQLSPELQMFNRIFQSVAEQQLEQKRQAEKIAEVESRVDSIRDVVSLDTTSWRDDTGKILKKIGFSLGGGQTYSQVRNESYELLQKRFGVNLGQRLTNKRRRMADEGVSKSRRDKLSYIDIIAGTTKGSVIDLEDGKEKLKKAFPKISGYHAVLDSGTHILAYYDAAIPITLDGNDIKKLQINLKIKSWEVDE